MSVPNPATTPWVPLWDTGAGGAPASPLIPGEIKLWGGKVLPELASYGKWVWADGTAYSAATYPKAAANIAPEWKTAHGQTDPGAGMFRVPDMRGLTPVGLDQMPGGARANRVTRAVAIIVAAKTGEETHIVSVAEMPSHAHGGNTGYQSHDHAHYTGSHNHGYTTHGGSQQQVHTLSIADQNAGGWGLGPGSGAIHAADAGWSGGVNTNHYHGVNAEGSGAAHETMQPSVFVPYIVALDS
jgi:microcystin-dependent protein